MDLLLIPIIFILISISGQLNDLFNLLKETLDRPDKADE